jgi:hypothetical protein
MSVCVVVANDDGARAASHALRAAGWGGVHFEANPSAAVRMTSNGRATVLNVQRANDDEVAAAIEELGAQAYDWRNAPPDLNQDEWAVLYDRHDLTPRTAANRLKSATEKLAGQSFETWRLPTVD